MLISLESFDISANPSTLINSLTKYLGYEKGTHILRKR